ncbi:MAG: thioredoxin family protein [Candidatus Dependentiae bacterium]
MKLYSSRICVLIVLALATAAPLHAAVKKVITSQKELNTAKNQGNVILKFTASWCPACQMIKADFEKLTNNYPNIYMAEVDVSANPDLATNNGVEGLPTFVFYKNGSVVDRVVGAPADFHGEMGQKIRTHFGSNGEKKKEITNGDQILPTDETVTQEEQVISAPVQDMPEEVTTSKEGILGQISGLFVTIFDKIKELILGIIDWFRRLLGL